MLKFPSVIEDASSHEYSNSCISEYIACHILQTLGLKVQETLLGKYIVNDNEKIVVACKDFTSYEKVFKQFAELKNSQIETSKNGYGTELSEVLETIEMQQIYDQKLLKEFFWNMFIADCLVGNFDRHNGNWGFLIDEKSQKVEIAPIYDCASCLYPQLTDEKIEEIIDDEDEMNARVYIFPTSALKEEDKNIFYYEYINSLKNQDCNDALRRLFPLIDINKINKIIDETPYITDLRKSFYKKIIIYRYEKILKIAFEKLK